MLKRLKKLKIISPILKRSKQNKLNSSKERSKEISLLLKEQLLCFQVNLKKKEPLMNFQR